MNMIAKMIALDWRSMKIYQIRGLILPAAAFLFGWFYGCIFVIPLSVIFCISFSINPFAVEDKGELNNFYLTLPLKRKEIVTGRYALSLIILLCGIIMSIIMMLITNQISMSKWFLGVEGYMVVIALGYLMYSLGNIFMFPILFRIGYTKGKFFGFYLPVIFFGVVFGVYTAVSYMPGNGNMVSGLIFYALSHMPLIAGGMAVLATVLLILSYFISVRMYSKRNF